MSGTTIAPGPTTNRIMSSGEPFVRVTIQVRSDPSSATARAAFTKFAILFVVLRLAGLGPVLRLRFRFRFRQSIDPASLQPGIHDEAFGFLARDLEPVENAGMLGRFAILALAPANQVVGGAPREILDRLDIIL